MQRTAGHEPLNAFPIIRSRNIEEIRQTLIQSYCARKVDVARGFEQPEFRLNYRQSQNISLSYFSFDSPFQIEFPTGEFYRQAFVQNGVDIRFGRVTNKAANANTCVVPPDAVATAAYSGGVSHFGFKVKTELLSPKLAALIGATPSRKLVFDHTTRPDGGAIAGFRRLLTFFAAELNLSAGGNELSVPVAELEQAVMVSFICSNPHNYTALLHASIRPAASWQVRRAEEYIAAHWNQPITIEDLAHVCSTSARSLFYQFKRSRGRSPMAFVKDIRLQRAREMLGRLDPATSITRVAVNCGFGNLGHFAKDYFKRFGERPSDTVRRGHDVGRRALKDGP